MKSICLLIFEQHAAIACERDLEIIWVEANTLVKSKVGEKRKHDDSSSNDDYDTAWKKLKSADGVIVPGGFGNRYVLNYEIYRSCAQNHFIVCAISGHDY